MRTITPFHALALTALLALGVGCGGDAGANYDDPAGEGGEGNNATSNNLPSNNVSSNNVSSNNGGAAPNNIVPEEEEFLVRQIATTSSYVFVPNSAEGSETVARIDGRDLSVLPLRVGREPTQVLAAEIEGQGAIAYVLCEGDRTLAIIRADELSRDGRTRGRVDLVELPREVNAIAMAPDGRHVVAYIDPDQPLLEGTSVASLQTMALVRLGDEPGEDEVFQLSVTRLIRDIEFTDDGEEVFIIGREGINRIALDEITRDAFIGPLRLDLSDSVFPPNDLEVEVSDLGDFFAVRSSQFAGVALFELTDEGLGERRLVELDLPPTDIDLLSDQGRVIVTSREDDRVILLDVAQVLDTPADEEPPRDVIEVGFGAGLAQLTPDRERALLYTTIDSALPSMGVLTMADEALATYQLRNQIRSVAISPDSQTAVVIHRRQEGTPPGDDALSRFRFSEGLTLLDVATGYRRPILLDATPEDVVMTRPDEQSGAIVYVMLRSGDPSRQGVMRVDTRTYRTDFVHLPRAPLQLGVVAGQVFVSQDATEGRITFLDIETNTQRTVSGYELNARID